MKLLLSSAVLAAFFILSGCGGTQCEQLCAQYNACPASQRVIDVDCIDFCTNVDALNVRTTASGVVANGCTDADGATGFTPAQLWTKHLDCWKTRATTQRDFDDPVSGNTIKINALCDTTFDECDASALAWQDCVNQFCDQVVAAGDFDRACQGEFEQFPNNLSLWSPFQTGF